MWFHMNFSSVFSSKILWCTYDIIIIDYRFVKTVYLPFGTKFLWVLFLPWPTKIVPAKRLFSVEQKISWRCTLENQLFCIWYFFKQSINQQKQLGYIFFFMSKQVTQPKISLILKQNENLSQKAIYIYFFFFSFNTLLFQ